MSEIKIKTQKRQYQLTLSDWLTDSNVQLVEATDQRSELGKVFRLGENHYRTVIYPEAIHFWDQKSEKYHTINNRLIQTAEGLKNTANGKLQVRMMTNCVELRNDKGQRLSLHLMHGQPIVPVAHKQSESATMFSRLLDPHTEFQSEAVYTGILPGGTDWHCKIHGEQFKDEIVFQELSQVRPVQFLLTAEGMTLIQDNHGEMHLEDALGETAFYLPAPLAFSAEENQENGHVAIQVTPKAKSSWLLTYSMDDAWLTQAAFPVRLDPAVLTYNARCAIDDAYTCSKQANTVHKGSSSNILRLTRGSSNWGDCSCFFKFGKGVMPALTASDYVIRAMFQVATAQAGYPTSAFTATAHEVLSDWSPATLTHNNQPSYQQASLDYSSFAAKEGEGVVHSFNITNLVRKWYNGTNHGVMLKAESQTYAQLRSSALGQTATHRPLVIIDYVSRAGLEDHLSYEEQSVGRAGTGYVSLFNGNLIYTHQDSATDGTLLPVSMFHVYNSCYSKPDVFSLGSRWKLNLNQALWKETISGITYYVWQDEDGTEVYFSNQNGTWKDELGRDLVLKLDTKAIIEDKQGLRRYFSIPTVDFNGDWKRARVMSHMEDATGNIIQLQYEDRKLKWVADGSGRKTQLTWSTNRMTHMSPPYAADQLAYQYTGENLTQITYADGLTTRYTYNGANLLTDVYHPEGIHLHYEYTAAAPYRVTGAKITSADGNTTAFWHTYEYRDMMTIVTDRTSGKKLRYHFNDAGSLIAVTDELGHGIFTKYQPAMQMNKPEAVSKLQHAMRNLLKNPIFSRDGEWQQSTAAGGTGTFSYDVGIRNIGNRSMCLNKTNNAGRIVISQASQSKGGQAYTISAYARGEKSMTLSFAVMSTNKAGAQTWFSSEHFPLTSTWQRYSYTFTTPTDGERVSIHCCASGGPGKVWLDGIQLEEGVIAGRLNLLDNPAFSYGLTGWTRNSDQITIVSNTEPDKPETLSSSVLSMKGGGPGSALRVYQVIGIRGEKGAVFVAGGWSRAQSVPLNGHPERYRMLVQFYSGSAWVNGASVTWSEEWTSWHMAAAPIVAPCAFTGVRVAVDYQNNYNTALFDGLFLHQEEFGHSYSYDSQGNLISQRDLTSQKDAATYDQFHNLLTYRQPGRNANEKTVLSYGSTAEEQQRRLLRTSTTPLGTVSRYTYDSKGNCTESTVEKDGLRMRTQTVYEADQNRIAVKIDARGMRVAQNVDPERGTLNWVQDPRGQTVYYAYDSMRRILRTETIQDTKSYYNNYAYQGDRLTQVRHNTSGNPAEDVVYSFEYDGVSRPTAVRVGGNLLSQTIYHPNGTTKQVNYGNGGVVAYGYDAFKRVTSVTYDHDVQPNYQYIYDGHGQVAQVRDLKTGTVVTSEYDLADRPMRKTTQFADGTRYVAQVSYDKYSNLQRFDEQLSNQGQFHTTFAHDVENRPTQLTFSSGQSLQYAYDGLSRMTRRALNLGGKQLDTAYTYLPGAQGGTTPLVQTITQSGATLTYAYDDAGNIISVSDGSKTISYEYDLLGQLTRVNDPYDTTAGTFGTTWKYVYDQGGNIQSKTAYAFTTGTVGAAVKTDSFTYGDANWKDKLTAFNGTAISYDAIGNPLSDGTWTYTWAKGRQLQSMSKSGETVSFVYNEDGLRVQKVATSTGTTRYTLHGKNIVHLTNGSNSLHFFYDAQNKPAVVIFNGTAYAYLYNLQGDVIGLVDSNGTKMVSYTYDAWGKPIGKTGTLASTLGTIQPFRYRGYVFDEETGLYYLRSRYYNSTCCRFIIPDSLLQKRHLPLGGNLFHYCKANPINKVDNDGYGDTYVIYYHWDGSKSSLKKPAQNAPYYDWEAVKGLEVASSTDFINAWNSMDDSDLDEVYIFVHGSPGKLNMDYNEICSDGKYSFDQLENKEIRNTIFLFSCYGAATDSNHSSVAVQLMNRTSAPKLYACEVGVSFSKIIAPGSARVTMKHYFDGVPYWAEYTRETNGIKKRLLDTLILMKE